VAYGKLHSVRPLGIRAYTNTSCSGSLTGSELQRKASARLKIAVLAPMPRARVRIATPVTAGAFISTRKP
jgi:hypothetical protein